MKRRSQLRRTEWKRPTHIIRRSRAALSKAASKTSAERKWQRAVRTRDNYTCQRCGKYDLLNHAHHIATRKRRPDLKYEPSNGITLCFACHQYVHDHPLESAEHGWLSTESYELARSAA